MARVFGGAALVFAACHWLCQCPVAAAQPPRQPESVLIKDVPFLVQKPDFCGEACAAMWLRKLGRRADQDYVFNQSGLDPAKGRGCYSRELAAALRKIGFRTGAVWHGAAAKDADREAQTQWEALAADLRAGVPSIVCMHYDDSPTASEHFRLVLGYEAATDAVVFHDPAVADGAYRRLPRAKFLKLWPLFSAADAMLIRLRLEPGELAPEPPPTGTFTPADFAQHVLRLKRKIPSRQFTVVVEPPFVVLGDEPPQEVRRHAVENVRWAVRLLKAMYFTKDPKEILDIWLFKDGESYRANCRRVFHAAPDTPYGYFSASDGALIMNIATGGGTLIHEIVHPFVAANFPHCPAWFNEGLGSLYEQCGEEDGRIHGYTNWRLRGLQEAIRGKHVPSFATLAATTDEQFYNEDRGTNYAQARYLCYYLQEHNLLRKYYHRFLADHRADPSGYKTLKAVLRRDDMAAFQKEWEAWAMKLRFPE